MSITGLIM